MTLILQILLLVLGVGGSIVSAVTLENPRQRLFWTWGFGLLGLAGLALTLITYEQTPGNTPYFSDAITAATAFAADIVRSRTFQIIVVFFAGLIIGWRLRLRNRRRFIASTPKLQINWKSSYDVLELAELSKVNARREQLSKITGLDVAIAEFERQIESEKKLPGGVPNKFIEKRDKYERWKKNEIRIRDELHLGLIEEIHEKLRTGDLISKGFLLPVEKDSTFVDIPAERWHFLRLNGDFIHQGERREHHIRWRSHREGMIMLNAQLPQGQREIHAAVCCGISVPLQ